MYRFGPKDSKGQSSFVIRLSDNKEIKLDPSDKNFTEFILWTSKGNKPESPKEVHPEPREQVIVSENGNSEKKTAKKKWKNVLEKKISEKWTLTSI